MIEAHEIFEDCMSKETTTANQAEA